MVMVDDVSSENEQETDGEHATVSNIAVFCCHCPSNVLLLFAKAFPVQL